MPAARKMEEPGFEPSPEDEEAFRLELEALGDSECSDTESEYGDGGAERYLLNNGGESSSDDDEAGEEPTCSQADDFSASLSNLKTLFR